ncbi:hypothetical protein DPMN_137062 [Dreissena polymorpha]|uniref:Tyr recombinase domain-containing protein n=1 Tax=Dreissena polymorpha TaxID=45954 RepID=A0A9D4G148_DREPO|nr:hypothetical protein DPMN_137062 [Dreissena polymorpha]
MTLHPGDSCVNNWMLKAMAKDAGFLKHKRITNHSVRKFLVQKLRNANIPPTETMAITGHKNVESITNYSNISVEQQQKCSFLLSPVNVTIQQIPLVHLHALKLWPKCSLDNRCLPSNKLILMFAPPIKVYRLDHTAVTNRLTKCDYKTQLEG